MRSGYASGWFPPERVVEGHKPGSTDRGQAGTRFPSLQAIHLQVTSLHVDMTWHIFMRGRTFMGTVHSPEAPNSFICWQENPLSIG